MEARAHMEQAIGNIAERAAVDLDVGMRRALMRLSADQLFYDGVAEWTLEKMATKFLAERSDLTEEEEPSDLRLELSLLISHSTSS